MQANRPVDQAKQRVAFIMENSTGYPGSVLKALAEVRPANWHVAWALPSPRAVSELRRWHPHGLVTHMTDRTIAESLLSLDYPVISISSEFPDLPLTVIEPDHHSVASLALEHFRKQGFTLFGFYGNASTGYAAARERAFRDAVQHEGHAIRVYSRESVSLHPSVTPWEPPPPALADWLSQLPRPTGILAANDVAASELLAACRALQIKVPHEISVMGVGNDERVCKLSTPALTSIEPDVVALAKRIVATLESEMAGLGEQGDKSFVPLRRVVKRRSTDTFAARDPVLRSAVLFIRTHATKGINVADVADRVQVSRRELERRFRQTFDQSILDNIQVTRIAAASDLLINSRKSVQEIARTAGFGRSSRMCSVFLRHKGCTPTAFRTHCRAPGQTA